MMKRTRIFLTLSLFLIIFINSGCIFDDKYKDYSVPNSAAFTNLATETVLLYIDGKLETQIFAETTYWIEVPSGHHKYAVYDKSPVRQEIMSGEFAPGDKINIVWK